MLNYQRITKRKKKEVLSAKKEILGRRKHHKSEKVLQLNQSELKLSKFFLRGYYLLEFIINYIYNNIQINKLSRGNLQKIKRARRPVVI